MKIKTVRGGLCAVKGVRAYGIKEGHNGLALIEGKGQAAGMYTASKIKAAPVLFTKRQLEGSGGQIQAIIANSGCANSFTDGQGMRNAEKMAKLAAASLGVNEEEIAVASTGPIGKQLDMELIERQLGDVVKELTSEAAGSTTAAKAILTTDTFYKERAIRIDTGNEERVVIAGIAKGSGMVFPHLATATMLSFIYTDARLSEEIQRASFEDAVANSFNMVVVDGDMSTNDLVLLVSTGQGGEISEDDFKEGLNFVCKEFAKLIARDGEGATKFIEARVKGAASVADAKEAAKSIVRSPLVKSAIFGERPDFMCGRIIAAIGSCTTVSDVDPGRISIGLKGEDEGKDKDEDEVSAVKNGEFMDLSGVVRELMKSKEIFIEVDLGIGESEATAWGCDLSYDYVKINSG
ncbi:MAG: bifunctional ornithine acetyltransferase/N-acetylglutamate synthase [Euryarchaeota archaeon]|nr:bifunctional ornithine acetyltransferase/N-acetylglutamate synthase [Euryarchaeota archaeon]